MLLVGDSLGMVLYGMDSTLPVTLDMMINHGAAVMRGSTQACVVVDLPFGSYPRSPEAAFRSAARVMAETGCAAVKLEDGRFRMAPTVEFLTRRGIPVLGHVGLTPQSVNVLGGYRARGRSGQEGNAIAAGVRHRGCRTFAIVIEGTVETLARQLTADLSVPTIGIGASSACDGQILVTEDIVGLFGDSRRNSSDAMPNWAPRSHRLPVLRRGCARAPLPRSRACLRPQAEREHSECLITYRSSVPLPTCAPASPAGGQPGQSRPRSDHGRPS